MKVAKTKSTKTPIHKKNGNQPIRPKRPLSAYNFFFKMERNRLLQHTEGKTDETLDNVALNLNEEETLSSGTKKNNVAQLVKIIACRWRDLKKNEKKKYEKLAANDMDRHLKEMKGFKRNFKKWAKAQAKAKDSKTNEGKVKSRLKSKQSESIKTNDPFYTNTKKRGRPKKQQIQHAVSRNKVFEKKFICGNIKRYYWNTLGRLHVSSPQIFTWTKHNETRQRTTTMSKDAKSDTQNINKSSNARKEKKNFLFYDFKLGRAYFSSFYFRDEKFSVGDFVSVGPNQVYRIIGAYQAMKSYIGAWSKKGIPTEEIQKRGHPYAIVVPLVSGTNTIEKMTKEPIYIESASMKSNGSSEQNFKVTSTQYTPANHEIILDNRISSDTDENNLYVLPLWLGDPLFSMEKIDVEIINVTSEGLKHNLEGKLSNPKQYVVMHCIKETREHFKNQNMNKMTKVKKREVLYPLTDAQVDILSSPVYKLMKKFLPKSWNPRFRHKHVQFVSKNTSLVKKSFTSGIPFEINYSSDENEMDVKMRQPITYSFVNIEFENLPLPLATSNSNESKTLVGSAILSLERVVPSCEFSSEITYLKMITTSIGHLSEEDGSSIHTIYKSVQSLFNIPISFNAIANITVAIQLGLKEGRFIQVKNLYKLNPGYKVKNLVQKKQKEENENKKRSLTNRKRIKLNQEQINEKIRVEKIRKRKFPMDDLELIEEDKLLRVHPPNPKNPPSLPILIPDDEKINCSNSREGLGSDVLQIFHFFRGIIGWRKKETPPFDINHLLNCCEEIYNGNAKNDGMLPPLVVHLFIVAIQYLINEANKNSELKALLPILNPLNWSEILRLYLDYMQATSISPSPAHVLRNFTKDDPDELPSYYYGYLGPPNECLAKAHAKLCKLESYMLTTKECMCLLRSLCDDITGNCPQVEVEINDKMEKMQDITKKKKAAKLHWRSAKLAYHKCQKNDGMDNNEENDQNVNTLTKSEDADLSGGNGANTGQEKIDARDKSQVNQSKVKPAISSNGKNSQLQTTKREFEIAEQANKIAADHYDHAIRNLIVRLEPIGYDRNYSAVYYCSHDRENLYLETFSLAPEEGGGARKVENVVWKRIANNAVFDEYVDSLDVRGIRERELKQNLLHQGYIKKNLFDDQKTIQIRKRKKEILLNKLEIAKKACAESNRRSNRLSKFHQQDLQQIEEELSAFNALESSNEESQNISVWVKTGFELLKEFENKKTNESDEKHFCFSKLWYRDYYDGTIEHMLQEMTKLEKQCSELSKSGIHVSTKLKSMKLEWDKLSFRFNSEDLKELNSADNESKSSQMSVRDSKSNFCLTNQILNDLKNALLDLEENVINLSGRRIEYEDRKKWEVDVKADDEDQLNLAWKKKVYKLRSIPNQTTGTIRTILISAIESARRANLIEITNELRSSLKLIRPDSGKNAKKEARLTLDRHGGYKSTDLEDANMDNDDEVSITEIYQKCDNSPKVGAKMLLYCLEHASFDRDEWRETVKASKTLSRFGVLLYGFAHKAYELINEFKTRRDALTESIKDWKAMKDRKNTKSGKLSKRFKSQRKYWVESEPLQKYVLAKVCGKYPWWPSRVHVVKDSLLKQELESLDRIVISLLGKEGCYVLTNGDQVKDFTPDILSEDVSKFDESIVLDWMESVKQASWLISRLPSS